MYSDFEVVNHETNKTYKVSIRDNISSYNYCSCPDFRVTALGTCKHVEYVLFQLLRYKKNLKYFTHLQKNEYSSLSIFYGFYRHLTLKEISHRIDFLIQNGYLKIEYSSRLPVIVFTEKGWEIERETFAEELLKKLTVLIKGNDLSFVMELKDRNRGMILLLIRKIRKTENPDFIPLLKAWQEIDYRKVREAIQQVINDLMQNS